MPRERMLQVAHHYEMFGGVSPINEQNRNLIAALKKELETNGPPLPIYWGNRNWHPLLTDTVPSDGQRMASSALSLLSLLRTVLTPVAASIFKTSATRSQLAGEDAPRIREAARVLQSSALYRSKRRADTVTALNQISEHRRRCTLFSQRTAFPNPWQRIATTRSNSTKRAVLVAETARH